MLLAGLASLLDAEPDLVVLGQAMSGPAAVEAWRRCRPHVAVVDLFMEGIDGIETVRLIRQADPDARIMMLSSSESPVDAALARSAHARGYVSKTARHEELVAVIREIAGGARWVERGVRPSSSGPQAELLSPRELEALGHLRQGNTYAEIAAAMHISERTAKWHVAAILSKLNVHDRAAAVARAFDLGLLQVARPGH